MKNFLLLQVQYVAITYIALVQALPTDDCDAIVPVTEPCSQLLLTAAIEQSLADNNNLCILAAFKESLSVRNVPTISKQVCQVKCAQMPEQQHRNLIMYCIIILYARTLNVIAPVLYNVISCAAVHEEGPLVPPSFRTDPE